MSIEAVISMGVILMVFLLGVGFFAYMIPKQNLQEEVRILSKTVKLEGGITNAVNVDGFKERLVDKGYADDKSEIKVVLHKETADGSESTILAEDGFLSTELVNRGDMYNGQFAVMKLVVTIPTNKNSILRPLKFFGVSDTKLSDDYIFVERMMSEYIGG